MSSSMYVPVAGIPASLEEITEAVRLALFELGFSILKIYFGPNERIEKNLLSSFIQVDGEKEEHQCWIAFDEVGSEVTEDVDRPFMASVTTRGDCIFAGAVAYAICRTYGKTIFNDSCQLDGQETYSAESMRSALDLLKVHS